MILEQFRDVCQAQPFRPFVMHIADGREIPVLSPEFVLTVPSGALTTEGGTTYATVVDGDEETKVEVEVGEAYGMDTEVLSGLEEGDTVLLPTLRLPGGGGGNGPQQGDLPEFGTNGGPGGPIMIEGPQ